MIRMIGPRYTTVVVRPYSPFSTVLLNLISPSLLCDIATGITSYEIPADQL